MIDKVLTGKYTAHARASSAIMLLIFWLTFNVIGAGAQRPAGARHRLR